MRIFTGLLWITLCLLPLQALSHSKLVSSEPADQAELPSPPENIVLNFNREVRLMKLELLNAKQEKLALGFKKLSGKLISVSYTHLTLPTICSV